MSQGRKSLARFQTVKPDARGKQMHTWYVIHALDNGRKIVRYCVDIKELIKMLETIDQSIFYTLESVTTEQR